MKILKISLFSLILVLTSKFGISQECFIMLPDLSGFDIIAKKPILESAACDLRESLPVEFQSQFKVYDFGFFSLNEYMLGDFQAVLENIIINEVNSPYYLVFGRQYCDSEGESKLWFALKLPNDPNSTCNNKESQIISILNDLYNPIDNPFSFVQTEIDIMGLIKLLKNCEDCENEIDDDEDGFVDCEDLDCMLQSLEISTSGLINNRSTLCPDIGSEENEECLIQNSEFFYSNNINDTESAIECCNYFTELENLPVISSGIPKGELLLIINSVKDFMCWQKSFRQEFIFLPEAECPLFCDYLTNYLNNLDVTATPYEELNKVALWCQEIKEKIKLKSLNVYRESLLFLLEWAVWDLGIESGVRLFSAISTSGRTFGEYKMLESLKAPISSFASLKYAQKFGIQTYEALGKIFTDLGWTASGKGVEFHHLIEVRFKDVKGVAEWLGSNTKKWKCIVVEANQAEHYPFFTKAWRNAIGYITDKVPITTANATLQDVKNAAKVVYKDYPEILNALGL